MDQIRPDSQSSHILPHIVQVYQPSVSSSKIHSPHIFHLTHDTLQTAQGNVTYQHTIPSDPSHIPVTNNINDIQNSIPPTQNHPTQIVIPCSQSDIQNIHHSVQTQVIHNSDLSQPLHIASHVILPPVIKQHVFMNGITHYYSHYEPYRKKLQSDGAVVDSNKQDSINEKHSEENDERWHLSDTESTAKKKRTRSKIANPKKWACNVRKIKHQKGEAYVSTRGKVVPERHIRNMKDCLKSCKYKCSERIADSDRELLFKAFYSLSSNEKKHYLLNTTERNHVRCMNSIKRQYSFRYFFLVRGVKHTVCKKFYLGTLAISQKPVYNVHSGKSDMNIPKPDGRGHSEASTHALPDEIKNRVRDHILTFQTIDCKPVKQFSRKKQYLDNKLSIRQMHAMYVKECNKEVVTPVKESMYRKIFKNEFNLHFKKEDQLCCRCKGPLRKK